ncbi:MAG: type II toxin-antitoxin system RelE/ParE family toxin [Candidatus Omnitrophica bacterium]|nr:type II toxin-antitoxin system RelE/ParE family toxin [Candidatus Omnitrophota bacterium]
MIHSFNCKDTKELFNREYSPRLPSDIQRTALRKLWVLDATVILNALRVPPGNKLEALTGNRSGQYSLRINDLWRLCFIWRDGGAHHVEIIDCH